VQRYQLAETYNGLKAALRAQRWGEASRALGRALGVVLPGTVDGGAIVRAASRLRRQLSYRGLKPAEVAMWRGGIKAVVKFEDLPVGDAASFAATVDGDCLASSPYRKDDLLLRSRPCAADHKDALVALYCSRGDGAQRLRRVEGTAREDVLSAAALLDIPSCCATAFADDFARARVDQDTVNDDACRRVLATAAPPGLGDWRLNPLGNRELLGFYPCACDCRAARQRASRVLAALDAADRDRARADLARHALYFRLPFFATMVGSWRDDRLHFGDFAVNGFDSPLVRTAQALLAAHLGGWIEGGDALSAHGGVLRLWRGDREIAVLAPTDGAGPLLCGFRDLA